MKRDPKNNDIVYITLIITIKWQNAGQMHTLSRHIITYCPLEYLEHWINTAGLIELLEYARWND